MSHDAGGAFMKQGSDSSPRLRRFRREGRPRLARQFLLRRVNIRHPDDPDIRVHIAESGSSLV
jgi:hypothetical protein